MISLTATRFNTQTWNERDQWIRQNNYDNKCIYGSPRQTKENIKPTIIVIEMHNDQNKIKAISLLKNKHSISDKFHQIYSDRNYNRYIYKGDYRIVIDHDEHDEGNKTNFIFTPFEKKVLSIITQLCFKGACHLKRSQGITAIPEWIMKNKYIDFLKVFKQIFTRYYKNNNFKKKIL